MSYYSYLIGHKGAIWQSEWLETAWRWLEVLIKKAAAA
jgi:hypothetical protein